MKPLTRKNANTIGLPPNVVTILNNLLNELKNDERFVPIDPEFPNKYKGCKNGCLLEFCFCCPCPGYKNAVWIKIHNINGKNLWYYIPFLKRDLKLKIFSQDDLLRHYQDTHITHFKLPVNCMAEFGPSNAYVTLLDTFGSINDKVSYSSLLDMICQETPFLCYY